MPGAGSQAKAMTTIMNAVQMINAALQDLDPTSRQARDVRRAIDQLSRHLPQGNAPAGAQRTDLMDTLRTVAQTALSQNVPQGGQNPMPSTPLPGA
jgi:ABC-type transporter Mla subunit MlaD